MIKGLSINNEVEKKIWQSFNGWAEHFIQKLQIKGFDYLLLEYEDMIQSLEEGKHDYSYEYVNDLSIRDAIQIILNCLPEKERTSVYSKVELLDVRLKAQIVPGNFICNERVVDQYPKEIFWWYYGLPKCIEP